MFFFINNSRLHIKNYASFETRKIVSLLTFSVKNKKL